MKIIIDTDPGQDDAMALMYILKQPTIDVPAITTVAGNTTINNTTRNAQFVLNLFDNKTPLYSGESKPLKRKLQTAFVHGKSGLEGINPTNNFRLTNDAPEQMVKRVAEFPGEVSILALGPLTNIAKAIQLDKNAMTQVKEIVIMGGAFNVLGNMGESAEFNMYVDPEAAATVMDLDVPKLLVPLDACNSITVDLNEFKQIKNRVFRETLLVMNKCYSEQLEVDTGTKKSIMYDPVAAFVLLNRTNCQITKASVQVDTNNGITRGRTSTIKTGIDPNISIVTSVPQEIFKASFFDALNNKHN